MFDLLRQSRPGLELVLHVERRHARAMMVKQNCGLRF